MTCFLDFHLIAATRGDGLRPELLELLTGAAATARDPRVQPLPSPVVQAGPNPASVLPAFLPGNVVDATTRFQRADPALQTSTKATTQG